MRSSASLAFISSFSLNSSPFSLFFELRLFFFELFGADFAPDGEAFLPLASEESVDADETDSDRSFVGLRAGAMCGVADVGGRWA